MRILICEDDPIHSMNLEMIFEDGGHQVVGIYGRADAVLLHCWRDAPDLAVVDLDLADGATGLAMVHTLDKLGSPASSSAPSLISSLKLGSSPRPPQHAR